MNALVSIHDVMPHTLQRVERILDWLKARHVPPVTLLVVPGHPWEPAQIKRLRELAAAGHELAAHGWLHETCPRRIYHRLHAALISRTVAEHLDLDSQGILQLMQRSGDWFGKNDLPLPDFYVPPAWALGPISKTDLSHVPFQLIETTRGLLHLSKEASPQASGKRPETGRGPGIASSTTIFQKLPLTGYEADTAFRECFLRNWNATQTKQAKRKKRPLRISIHPNDLDLRVADQLEQHIRDTKIFLPYKSLMASA